MKKEHTSPNFLELNHGILPKNLPKRSILETYRPHSSWYSNPKKAFKSEYDLGHLTRVLIIQDLLATKLQEMQPSVHLDRDALRWSAVTHDVKKTSIFDVRRHGRKAAHWVATTFASTHYELTKETLQQICLIDYYHGDTEKRSRTTFNPSQKIFKDADFSDTLRLGEIIPLISRVPFIRRSIKNIVLRHYSARMFYNISKDFFVIAETLNHESKKDPLYKLDPFVAVLNTAEQLGLIQPN